VHTYGNPGIYSVTLTASSAVAGTSTKSRENYIAVTNPGSNPAVPAQAAAGISPTTGAMVIGSTPGSAGVFLEGKVMGATPLTISDIHPGTYSLKLVMAGYPDYSTIVTVTAGQSTVINVDLASPRQQPTAQQPVTQQPVTSLSPVTGSTTNSQTPSGAGSLSVTTRPPGAKVYVDDVMGGVAPATIPGLSAGPHTIRLVMDGYEEMVGTVTIIPGQTQEYSTSLSPKSTLPGGVNIPGLNKVPGFESGVALAGLCICGVVLWIFSKGG
jgi:PKD repeat protein